MIHFLAYLTFALLMFISALHIYWAFGGYWPAKTLKELPRTVGGAETEKMPSMILTLVVAAMIFLAGLMPLFWLQLLPAPLSRTILAFGMTLLSFIFLTRGVISYMPLAANFSISFVEPFATLNRRYYSPLCIAIGVSIMLIRFI